MTLGDQRHIYGQPGGRWGSLGISGGAGRLAIRDGFQKQNCVAQRKDKRTCLIVVGGCTNRFGFGSNIRYVRRVVGWVGKDWINIPPPYLLLLVGFCCL